MSRITAILEQFSADIMPEILTASKRFAPTVKSEITSNANGVTLEISGSPYLSTLWEGRKPTSPSAKKGNPTLQQILLKWIESKSIVPKALPNGNIPTLEQLSWAMAKSMHKKGDLLYQRGGTNNSFDMVLTKSRIDNLINLLVDEEFKNLDVTLKNTIL